MSQSSDRSGRAFQLRSFFSALMASFFLVTPTGARIFAFDTGDAKAAQGGAIWTER